MINSVNTKNKLDVKFDLFINFMFHL